MTQFTTLSGIFSKIQNFWSEFSNKTNMTLQEQAKIINDSVEFFNNESIKLIEELKKEQELVKNLKGKFQKQKYLDTIELIYRGRSKALKDRIKKELEFLQKFEQ